VDSPHLGDIGHTVGGGGVEVTGTTLGTKQNKKKTNSGALIRQRTISTERPPLVGEVSANFSG
jgi:hypothetical protein